MIPLANDPQRLKRLIALEAEHHAASAELAKRSLKEFVKQSWHIVEPAPFVDGRVVDALCEHLEAVTAGQIRRLLVNIPPRHSKSSIISVVWGVWDWLHHPEDKFLHASYSLDLSTRDNRRKRMLIESAWFQERYGNVFKLASDQNVKRFFENDKQGYHMAVSVDGATTGHGGSKLILDDPHSAAEAHSEAERSAALRWFREVWTNRLNDQNKDCMVAVGQRIHENDVSGYIIKERPDWVHLNLPAFYEPARHCITPIWEDWRRGEGELLWPERFSKEALEGLQRDLGATGFAAQYQQTPVPSAGGQFKQKWFRHYTQTDKAYCLVTPDDIKQVLINRCRIIITVDLAISQKETADYTVIAVWAITPDKDLLLIDRIRDRLDNPEQQQAISTAYHRWHSEFIQIESVAYQLAIIQQLRRQGLPVREYKPIRDKVARASTAAVYYEGGRIYHPKQAHWLAEFEDELLKFPLAAHDDQVDATSMACESLAGPTGEDHVRYAQRYLELRQRTGPAPQ